MAQYDDIFHAVGVSSEELTAEEAVAAIAVVVAAADTSLDELDVDFLADVLWEFDIFEEYSNEDLLDILDRVLEIAEDEELGVVFNTANKYIGEELVLDAFGVGVSVLVDEETFSIPLSKMTLLKEFQKTLGVEETEAGELIDEVIAAIKEAETSYVDDEYETIILENFHDKFYSSPLGNFRLEIPVRVDKGGKLQFQEGMVEFSDNFGTLLRIDYYSISQKQAKKIQSLGLKEYLPHVLLDKYVPWGIVANLPKSKVEYSEFIEQVMSGAYFILIYMPDVATVPHQESNGSGAKKNAYRGLLIFKKHNFLYVVSKQNYLKDSKGFENIEQQAKETKQQIFDFIDSIDFFDIYSRTQESEDRRQE
ncbi:hypothetical protein [Mastigocoleus sp. MO_188.B34]|uniref:hypothetical protein n=1 Tax=Mastigocoleus sp. MO_188.B34 TaxID=3036635 RepID=UPI00262DD440|nr:hypothetical protein [Mastigocoleus sp. MO_188.B34]MDJ0695443.1 hypothetical protein [Mastigocoleus sp. MO_188.B34]